jgi:hypothetical protein
MTGTVKLMKAKKIPIGQSTTPKMTEDKTLNINLPLQKKQIDEDLLKNSAGSSNPKPEVSKTLRTPTLDMPL